MKTTMRRPGRKNQDIPFDELPNKARQLRIEAGMTLPELAEKIGTHFRTLSEYELYGRGGRSFVYRLADEFGIDVRELETPGKKFSGNLRHLAQ